MRVPNFMRHEKGLLKVAAGALMQDHLVTRDQSSSPPLQVGGAWRYLLNIKISALCLRDSEGVWPPGITSSSYGLSMQACRSLAANLNCVHVNCRLPSGLQFGRRIVLLRAGFVRTTLDPFAQALSRI